MTVSVALSCGFNKDCHYDDSGGINYDHNMFIVQAIAIKGPVTNSIMTFCIMTRKTQHYNTNQHDTVK